MHEVISMSIKDLDRLRVIDQLAQKQINQQQAADVLGLSRRQIKRIVKAHKLEGPKGVISKKRGKVSNRQIPVATKELAKTLIEQKYVNFGPTLAHEKLIKDHHLIISVGSIRNLMIANGLWSE